MFERAFDVLLIVSVFMIIAYAFISMFGYPTCASMANKTAMDLKNAINIVADKNFPTYNYGIPTDPEYYKTVPIRLCQQNSVYAFFLQFAGGIPEYQIYYEHFPESGGGSWNEAYPWSGGAGSSLVFWGVMRGVTWITPRLTKTYWAIKAFNKLKLSGLMDSGAEISRWEWIKKFLWKSDEVDSAIMQGIININGYDLEAIGKTIAEKDVDEILSSLKKAGFLKSVGNNLYVIEDAKDGLRKLVINDQEVPYVFISKVQDPTDPTVWNIVSKGLAVKTNPDGTFDWDDVIPVENPSFATPDIITQDGKTYAVWKVKPDETMKDLIGDLSKENPARAEVLDKILALPDGTEQLLDPKTTSLYEKIKDATIGRIKRLGEWLSEKGLNTKSTISTPVNTQAFMVSLGEAAEEDPEIYDKFFKKLSDLGLWQDFKDKVKVTLNLATEEEITATHVKNFFIKSVEERAGLTVIEQESKQNIWRYFMNEISVGESDVDSIIDRMKNKLPGFNDFFAGNKFTYNGLEGDDALKNLGNHIKSMYAPGSEFVFYKNTYKDFWYYMRDLPDGQRFKEMGLIIGAYKQDLNPHTYGWVTEYVVRQTKKMVYIDGTALIAPNSWIGKGIIMSGMTEGCQGKSVCLYIHGAQYESPYYLNESVQENVDMIRVWRPVDPWKNYVGWTAALKRVPEHPRFYVVSPCFAIAKIWKAQMGPEKTIFVYPMKVDVGDKASNYCYADENLVNEYTAIWVASDSATVVQTVLSFGVASGRIASEAVKASLKDWAKIDPVTLMQSLAEAAISWPGWPPPPKDMTFDVMNSEAGKAAFANLGEQLKAELEK